MIQISSLLCLLALAFTPQGGSSSQAGGTPGNQPPVQTTCPCSADPANSYVGGGGAGRICADGSIVYTPLRATKEPGQCKASRTGCNIKEEPCSSEQEVMISFSPTVTPCETSVTVEGGGFSAGTNVNSTQSATLSASAQCGASDTDSVTVTLSDGSTVTCNLDLTCKNCDN